MTEELAILQPIEDKIRFWIEYERNMPQIPYGGNEIFFDEYRQFHDLDCQLLGGQLGADTIFSLWRPLEYTLLALHAPEDLQKDLGTVRKRRMFLQGLLNRGLGEYFPVHMEIVQHLSQLFDLGQKRENVMLLSNRGLNEMRAVSPYEDYMPYFLKECFKGGKFYHIFNHDEGLLRFWLMREELQVFFEDGYLVPEAILDLAGTGDVTVVKPVAEDAEDEDEYIEELSQMFAGYVEILQARAACLEQVENAPQE